MSVQVVETYVVWVGKTDRIASFRKVEGYEDTSLCCFVE